MSNPDRKQLIIHDILSSYAHTGIVNDSDCPLPTQQDVQDMLSIIKNLLFPGYFSPISQGMADYVKTGVDHLIPGLTKAITQCLNWASKGQNRDHEVRAQQITEDFLTYIPHVRRILKDDAKAMFDEDPAAGTEEEVILAYPGFWAVTVYRVAHFLHNKSVPLMPRMMSYLVQTQTGVDIHPAAKIGRHFCIDHGTGVVIGGTAVIGNYVKLYHGVTLGALSVVKAEAQKKRHPTIEDRVTIYAGTTILGGDTVIGENCILGGNSWITKSVAPNTKLYLSSDLKQVRKSLKTHPVASRHPSQGGEGES